MAENQQMEISVKEELEVLIRARYPIIYVVSSEEERVCKEINKISKQLNKKLFEWTYSKGITRYRDNPTGSVEGKKGTKDPIMALNEIGNSQEASIFILKDFHNYLKDSAVVRNLRDLAQSLKNTSTNIIILSPIMYLPDELEKDISIIDFPLPSKDELLTLLEKIREELKDNENFTIDLTKESAEKILDAAIGLTYNEAENVIAKTLVLTQSLTGDEAPLIYSEKKQIVRKSGLLEYIETDEKMMNVGGLKSLKEWLKKRKSAFTEEARDFGLPAPKGVLFLGVQGCGKSLCAKAVSSLWEIPLVRLDMGKLFSSFVGSSEQNVRKAINIAESVSPIIMWIDEIDKGFSGIHSSSFSDSGTTSRVFGNIITWLQEKKEPVFVIATANDISVLPPELLRKGRFDEIFFVDLPGYDERLEIFSIHLEKRGRTPDKFVLDLLAKETDGFSGAEIEQCIISAMFDAFDKKQELTTTYILNDIRATMPLSVTMKESIQKSREWAKARARIAS